jgi:hypothetical protein
MNKIYPGLKLRVKIDGLLCQYDGWGEIEKDSEWKVIEEWPEEKGLWHVKLVKDDIPGHSSLFDEDRIYNDCAWIIRPLLRESFIVISMR